MNSKKSIQLTVAAVATLFFGSANAALIEVCNNGGSITSLDQASTIMDTCDAVDYSSSHDDRPIDYDDLGDGTRGNFSTNRPFPGANADYFVVLITGLFEALSSGDHFLGLNHDDGAELWVNGSSVYSGDGVVDNRNGGALLNLTQGFHDVSILFFENRGGASLEFFASRCANCERFNKGLTSVPEPGTMALLGLGLLGMGPSPDAGKSNVH